MHKTYGEQASELARQPGAVIPPVQHVAASFKLHWNILHELVGMLRWILPLAFGTMLALSNLMSTVEYFHTCSTIAPQPAARKKDMIRGGHVSLMNIVKLGRVLLGFPGAVSGS